MTSNLYRGEINHIPIFNQVLKIFVLFVVHDNQFRNGVVHTTPACKNHVAPVAHTAPFVQSIPLAPVDPVAPFAQVSPFAQVTHCIP